MFRRALAILDQRYLGGRVRDLYYVSKDLLWHAAWLARGRPFVIGRIQWAALAAEVPETLHAEIARRIRECLVPLDNTEYFTSLGVYGGSDWALHGADNPFELFPPNVACLDFLVRSVGRREELAILDFGCGVGNLIVYLRHMGFAKTFGYDNFSQVSVETTRRFLSGWRLESALLESRDLAAIEPAVVVVGSLPWSLYADGIEPILARPSLRYALLDAFYPCPLHLPGFRRIGEYRRLLRIFEKDVKA